MIDSRTAILPGIISDEVSAASLAEVAELVDRPFPSDRKELSELNGALERTLASLESLAQKERDPSVVDAVLRLQEKVSTKQKQLNGRIWSLFVSDLDLSQRTKPLGDAELQSLLNFSGDRLSSVEKKLLEWLDTRGLITPQQRLEMYLPARVKSWQLMQDDMRFGNVLRSPGTNIALRTAIQEVAPFSPTMAFMLIGPGALGSLAAIPAYAALGAGLEAQSQMKEGTSATLSTVGMPRLELRQHPLARIAERAQDDDVWKQIKTTPQVGAALVRQELKRIDELLTLDDQISGYSPELKRMHEAARSTVEGYRELLVDAVRGQAQNVAESVAIARDTLKTARHSINAIEKFAKSQSVGWSEQDQADLNRVLLAQMRRSMFGNNAALGQVVGQISGKYGVDERVLALNQGQQVEAKHLLQAEIDAIRLASGDQPSLIEVMGLLSLVRAGLTTLNELWPDLNVQMADDLDTVSLFHALDEARPGGNKEKVANAIARVSQYAGLGASATLGVALGFTLLGSFASMVPYLAGAVGGNFLSAHVRNQGRMEKASFGNLGQGRPVHDPFALVLERWSRPDFLEGSGKALRERAAREADLIETMTGSTVQLLRALAQGPMGEDIRTTLLPAANAVADLGKILRLISKDATLSDTELREAVRKARGDLFGNPAISHTITQGMMLQGLQAPNDPLMPAAATRNALLGRMAWLVERYEKDQTEPLNIDLVGAAWDLERRGYGAVPKKIRKKVARDDLDAFAAKLSGINASEMLQPVSIETLKSFIAQADSLTQDWNAANASFRKIDEKTAKGLAENLFADFWNFALPIFAGREIAEKDPKLSHLEVEEVVAKPPEEMFEGFLVTGSIGKNGHFEVPVSSTGEVAPQAWSIQLDSATQERCAMAHLAHHLQVTGVDTSDAKVMAHPKSRNDAAFGIRVGQQIYRVPMGPNGLLNGKIEMAHKMRMPA